MCSALGRALALAGRRRIWSTAQRPYFWNSHSPLSNGHTCLDGHTASTKLNNMLHNCPHSPCSFPLPLCLPLLLSLFPKPFSHVVSLSCSSLVSGLSPPYHLPHRPSTLSFPDPPIHLSLSSLPRLSIYPSIYLPTYLSIYPCLASR